MSSNRFDYVKYDEIATAKSAAFKAKFIELESLMNDTISTPPGPDGAETARSKALFMTQLEFTYMCVGKAIRNEQVAMRGAELQEGRDNA